MYLSLRSKGISQGHKNRPSSVGSALLFSLYGNFAIASEITHSWILVRFSSPSQMPRASHNCHFSSFLYGHLIMHSWTFGSCSFPSYTARASHSAHLTPQEWNTCRFTSPSYMSRAEGISQWLSSITKGEDISPCGHFSTWIFLHKDISPQGHFSTWTFLHKDISPQGHFSTAI